MKRYIVTGQILVDVRAIVHAETSGDAHDRVTCMAMDRSTADLRRGAVTDALVVETTLEAREVPRAPQRDG